MYKIASARAQDVARRLKLSDLCTRDFEPSDLERRDNLKAQLAAIERTLLALPAGHPRRAELGQEKFRIQNEMRAIQPRWKGPDVGDCLLKVIKAEVTKHQWAMWVAMAEELKKEADAAAATSNK